MAGIHAYTFLVWILRLSNATPQLVQSVDSVEQRRRLQAADTRGNSDSTGSAYRRI